MIYLMLLVLTVLVWALLEPCAVDRKEHVAALPFLPTKPALQGSPTASPTTVTNALISNAIPNKAVAPGEQ